MPMVRRRVGPGIPLRHAPGACPARHARQPAPPAHVVRHGHQPGPCPSRWPGPVGTRTSAVPSLWLPSGTTDGASCTVKPMTPSCLGSCRGRADPGRRTRPYAPRRPGRVPRSGPGGTRDTSTARTIVERLRAERAAEHRRLVDEILATVPGGPLSAGAAQVALDTLMATVRQAPRSGVRVVTRDGLACTMAKVLSPQRRPALHGPSWSVWTPRAVRWSSTAQGPRCPASDVIEAPTPGPQWSWPPQRRWREHHQRGSTIQALVSRRLHRHGAGVAAPHGQALAVTGATTRTSPPCGATPMPSATCSLGWAGAWGDRVWPRVRLRKSPPVRLDAYAKSGYPRSLPSGSSFLSREPRRSTARLTGPASGGGRGRQPPRRTSRIWVTSSSVGPSWLPSGSSTSTA